MIEAKQNFALKKFLTEIVVPDMPPGATKSHNRDAHKNQSDRPQLPELQLQRTRRHAVGGLSRPRADRGRATWRYGVSHC